MLLAGVHLASVLFLEHVPMLCYNHQAEQGMVCYGGAGS